MGRRFSGTLAFLCSGLLFLGCADTPKKPELRPIPPPPSAPPPPPIVYVPSTAISPNVLAGTTPTTPATPSGDFEVITNIVGNAQTPIISGQTPVGMTFTNQSDLPQFEMVPERPGPNFEWQDGFWQWQGTAWVWVPGQWVFSPAPSVIVVPQFYGGWYFGPRWGPPPPVWRPRPPGPLGPRPLPPPGRRRPGPGRR